MKILGFIVGLVVSLTIWVASYALVATVVVQLPEAYKNWGLAGGLVALGFAAVGGRRALKATIEQFEYMGRQAAKRRAAKQAEVGRHIREESQRHADQKWLLTNLQRRLENSHAVAEGLPALVNSAERALDQAEEHFTSGLYVPFWDAVESAVNSLATFNAHLEVLTNNARHYDKDASRLETPPPKFTLGLPALPNVALAAERMQAIIFWSHSNHEFCSLYEMRKFNGVPAGGFANLADGIHHVKTRLEESAKELMAALSASPSPRSQTSSLPKGLGDLPKI